MRSFGRLSGGHDRGRHNLSRAVCLQAEPGAAECRAQCLWMPYRVLQHLRVSCKPHRELQRVQRRPLSDKLRGVRDSVPRLADQLRDGCCLWPCLHGAFSVQELDGPRLGRSADPNSLLMHPGPLRSLQLDCRQCAPGTVFPPQWKVQERANVV